MFKLVIFLSIAALSTASNIDKIFGPAEPIAVSPNQGEGKERCGTYVVTKTDTKCTCGDKADLPLAELTSDEFKKAVNVVVIEVTRDDEAAATKLTSKDCDCGGKDVEVGIFRYINDNYFLSYMPLNRDVNNKLAVLNRKTPDTRASFDAVVEAVGFNKNTYTLICDSFSA